MAERGGGARGLLRGSGDAEDPVDLCAPPFPSKTTSVSSVKGAAFLYDTILIAYVEDIVDRPKSGYIFSKFCRPIFTK